MGAVLDPAVHLLLTGRMITKSCGLYLSFCCLSASSRFRRAAALAACFSVPSMMFSVTKSRPAEVDGLQNPFQLPLSGCTMRLTKCLVLLSNIETKYRGSVYH